MSARPVLLRGDATTPPQRTPWAGSRLASRFGKRPRPEDAASPIDRRSTQSLELRIGEAWELSLGDEFPSATVDGVALRALVDREPDAWLGIDPERARGLLVKLLDADDALSVQIHPRDDDPHLAPDEAGKPESWYVVSAAADAWIAFGWCDGVTQADVRTALARADGSLAGLLQRVRVEPGDTFVVEAGTPHAIGPGVTLVEPQYVAAARRGVTYRYWDWDRRYDTDGRESTAGVARPLHVEEALRVTDFTAAGPGLLARAFHRYGAATDGPLAITALLGPGTPIASGHLRMERIAGSGRVELAPHDALQSLTVVDGTITLEGEHGVLTARRGQTVALPARGAPFVVVGHGAHAIRASIVPHAPRPR